MAGWLKDGRVKYQETVMDGIAAAPAALIGLMAGENNGKMLVSLATEQTLPQMTNPVTLWAGAGGAKGRPSPSLSGSPMSRLPTAPLSDPLAPPASPPLASRPSRAAPRRQPAPSRRSSTRSAPWPTG